MVITEQDPVLRVPAGGTGPYTVPDGFFDDMERALRHRLAADRCASPARRLPDAATAFVAILLAALACFVGYSSLFRKPPITADTGEYVSPVPRSIYNISYNGD